MAEPQQDMRDEPAGGGAGSGDGAPASPNWQRAKRQELVLKVRIQSPKENDFIEVELNRQELSYQNLLQVSCCELGINPDQVEKIRKLPNTLLRKDKDILRLRDLQEVELILMKTGSSQLIEYTPSLIEKPCYNSNAAKMTY
ncbi:putative ANKRD40 C-terminal-like protein isoform X2 [Equus asinus]|uniref:ANKRD40 C-terminal like n=3 Tax=Equus TaxID=9789 RepID=A0A9L0SQZ4_HORSE|nr:ankyrin repeat domain-containing protein 40-like isoform X2 [Equus caballus]XP_044600631.1 putative ANKRD40 C-terminal-like protein isoform X2 [Equus asinus]